MRCNHCQSGCPAEMCPTESLVHGSDTFEIMGFDPSLGQGLYTIDESADSKLSLSHQVPRMLPTYGLFRAA